MTNAWQKLLKQCHKQGDKMKKSIIALFLILVLSISILAYGISKNQNIVLTEENHASLVGEVNGGSVETAILKLRSLDQSKTRYFYIDSPGGEVINGMRLINYLRSAEGKGIVCIAEKAMSMAFVALQSCETRLVIENTMLMSHGIAGGMQGYIKQIESELILAKKLDYILQKIQANRLGITIEQLLKNQNAEWWIIGIEDALNNNATDGVANVSCSLEIQKPIKVKNDEGQEITISKCPL